MPPQGRPSEPQGGDGDCPPHKGHGDEKRPPHRPHGKQQMCCSSFPEMITAASVVSVGLTDGRRTEEVESLLNFIGLLECNLKFILAQRIIDDKNRHTELELELGD